MVGREVRVSEQSQKVTVCGAATAGEWGEGRVTVTTLGKITENPSGSAMC